MPSRLLPTLIREQRRWAWSHVPTPCTHSAVLHAPPKIACQLDQDVGQVASDLDRLERKTPHRVAGDQGMRFVLTQAQLEGLKTHVYKSQGVSLIESLVLKRLWRWLVSLLPSSLAPNLITFAGFVIAMATSLAVILPDLNAEGKSPQWTYLCCAAGLFIYQTLDGMDGIQARRIGLSTPLGEFFDHGLDAILTFVYAAVAGCSVGINQGYPFLGLLLGVAVLLVNFFYHWQTFVSGVLHFKTIDIAEAHYAQISVLCLSGLLGTHFWTNLFPGLALELKVVLVYGTLVFTVLNLLHAFYIILTCGVGKNGSTVADTSVLSPIISPIVVTTTLVYHALYSPSQLVHTHYILFFTAFGIQVTKITLLMMMAGMTRTPYPLLDPIMVGPVLLCLNMHFPLIPDLLLMSLVAVYAVFDVSQTCVMSIHQICCFLDVPCFSVPLSQSTDQQETPEKTSQTPGSHKE